MASSPGVGAPFDYSQINTMTSPLLPSTVRVSNTGLSRFFQRYLIQQAQSVFEWKLPETWAKNYFLYSLYCWGYGAVVNTDRYGVLFQACGLSGYDIYYQPTNAVITNPLLRGTLRPRIGLECEIIRLQPDYGGIYDMISYYSDMMALCAESAGVNILNSKLSFVFSSSNKAMAESFKKLYDQIASGEPASFIDKNLTSDDKLDVQMLQQNVGNNYIADRLISDLRKINSEFLTKIGIPNANTDKKERLISDEVNANNIETETLAAGWLEELQKSCARVNAMFGTNLSVKWRFGSANNESNNINIGSLYMG